jgi:hypothetical protein
MLDKDYLKQIIYFWKYKRNIEQYTDYNRERLNKVNPHILRAWEDYKRAEERLNNLTDN